MGTERNSLRRCLPIKPVAPVINSMVKITDAELWGDEETFTAYGYSKYLAELEVWRGIEEGLKCCFFNPGVVLGLGTEQSPLNQLLAQQNKKNVWLTKGSTGFVAVEDVSQ